MLDVWQERKQRTELLATLQSEQERLELHHKAELDALQKKQAEQLKDLHKSHLDQVGKGSAGGKGRGRMDSMRVPSEGHVDLIPPL